MIKRFFGLLLSIVIIFSFAACNDNDDNDTVNDDDDEIPVIDPNGGTNEDGSVDLPITGIE